MKRLNIMVLGATGFTGKHVVKQLALMCKEPEYFGLTWGIAGRSQERLQNILTELELDGLENLKPSVVHCDISDDGALLQTCSSAEVLMNCTGPYTELSDPVVAACIRSRTHYVDISAELHHMLSIYRKYDNAAREAKVLIIPACGFASIPATMGLTHLEKNFGGRLQSVECYVHIDFEKKLYYPGRNRCLVHYGTWSSLVHELNNFSQYDSTKKETFTKPVYGPEPQEMKKSFFHRKDGKVWFPYPGPDKDIVEMTHRHLSERGLSQPIHFKSYTSTPLICHLILLTPAFFCYYWLCKLKCFRNLLWKHPKLFSLGYMSHEGPSERNRNNTIFSFNFTGTGWEKGTDENTPPTKKMSLKVFGSDPAYKTTASCILQSAITLVEDRSVMPEGGVLTSGVAFRDTKLIERLNKRHLNFQFV